MKLEQEKRIDFWNYLVSEKVERPKGVTDKRLEKVKADILADDNFWFQVVARFGAEYMTASEVFEVENRYRADQIRGQFWSMVRERIVNK